MPFLVLGVVSRAQLHAVYMQSLFGLISGMGGIHGGYALKFEFLIGKSNIHQARSMILTRFYDNYGDDDLFLFVDSDQTFTLRDVNRAIQLNSDVACGIYSNRANLPTSIPENPAAFFKGEDNDLKLGGTGFMMIRRPLLHKLKELITFELGNKDGRVWLGKNDPGVIPFFKERIIEQYVGNPANKMEWLGEDYSFCWLVKKAGGTLKGFISPTITHNLLTQYNFIPKEYSTKNWGTDSITFFCGQSRVPFAPLLDNMGGSEQAVVNLAREWKKRGKEVTVIGNVVPGDYDGVNYLPISEFDPLDKFGTVVLWRRFGLDALGAIRADKIYLDLHDRTQIQPTDKLDKLTGVFTKSNMHSNLFPMIPQEKFQTIPNAIDEMFIKSKARLKRHDRNRFIYASCYLRGLIPILQFLWPVIKHKFPDAQLDLYYGMDLVPEQIRVQIAALIEKMPGVTDHGRVSLETVKEAKEKAGFHLYFANPPEEIDCISLKESVAVGCIPIISDQGVFAEREGYHIKWEGNDIRQIYSQALPHVIKLLEMDDDELDSLKMTYYNNEELYTWDDVAEKWLECLSRA